MPTLMLLLFQSKSISEEEWNNTPLTGKIGSILSEQVRNSYAGVFNCPSRFDKLKTIVNNIKNGKFVVDPEESETNLIKQSFNNCGAACTNSDLNIPNDFYQWNVNWWNRRYAKAN